MTTYLHDIHMYVLHKLTLHILYIIHKPWKQSGKYNDNNTVVFRSQSQISFIGSLIFKNYSAQKFPWQRLTTQNFANLQEHCCVLDWVGVHIHIRVCTCIVIMIEGDPVLFCDTDPCRHTEMSLWKIFWCTWKTAQWLSWIDGCCQSGLILIYRHAQHIFLIASTQCMKCRLCFHIRFFHRTE